MIRTILILSLSPFLASCDLNDLINPGAASREAYEHRQSILMQPVKETPKTMHVEPDVYSEPTNPACYAIFRVRACSETGEEIWL